MNIRYTLHLCIKWVYVCIMTVKHLQLITQELSHAAVYTIHAKVFIHPLLILNTFAKLNCCCHIPINEPPLKKIAHCADDRITLTHEL